uniref:Uncharacterized protein n=1 Tax=Faecalibaculum rodentium TaxID=1702221 RepID=A0A140DRL3_9FIRM|nr:hypothetical protein AALO17_01560 [Faecalibaculum rodentium]
MRTGGRLKKKISHQRVHGWQMPIFLGTIKNSCLLEDLQDFMYGQVPHRQQ